MAKNKSSDDIYEMVTFIKDRMATKGDLAEVKDDLAEVKDDLAEVKDDLAEVKTRVTAIEGKLDGVNRRVDLEVDKRKMLEVQTAKLAQRIAQKN